MKGSNGEEKHYESFYITRQQGTNPSQQQQHQHHHQHQQYLYNNQYVDSRYSNRDYSRDYSPHRGGGNYGDGRTFYNQRHIFGPPCCSHLNLHPTSSSSPSHLHSIHHPPPQYRDEPTPTDQRSESESPHRNFYTQNHESSFYEDSTSSTNRNYQTVSPLTLQHSSSSSSSRFGLPATINNQNVMGNPMHGYSPQRVDHHFKIKFPGDLGTLQQFNISNRVKTMDKSVMATPMSNSQQQEYQSWSSNENNDSMRSLMIMKSPIRMSDGVPDLLPSLCVLRQSDFTTNYDSRERSSPGQRRRNNYDDNVYNRRRGGEGDTVGNGSIDRTTTSKWDNVRKYVKGETKTFFGLEGGDDVKDEWLSRRKRFVSRSYSEKGNNAASLPMENEPPPHRYDQADGIPTIDQAAPIITSRGKTRRRKKDHIFMVYWNIIRWIFWSIRFGRSGRRVPGGPGYSSDLVQNLPRNGSKLSGRVTLDSKMYRDRMKSRSISPTTLSQVPANVTISSHELFFDEDDGSNRNSSQPPGQGLYWRVPNRPYPSTINSGIEAYHISAELVSKILDNSARKKYRQKIRQPTGSVRRKGLIDEYNDYRPYFTYFITIVHFVILITTMITYGIAPIRLDLDRKSSLVLVTSLSLQQVEIIQPSNFWIGPSAADLIHLGAKYAPCMRRDEDIHRRILEIRDRERQTACCIRNDNSGCVQSSRNECSIKGVTGSRLLSTWKNWTGEDNRISGSVCGLDPRFCEAPASVSPFQWPDDITKWPICRKNRALSAVATKDNAAEHMVCEVIGHPCCIGIHAKCMITTREYCRFVNGYFHEEASLCSQVACLEDVCGMFPFLDYEKPDQFYRLFSSLFLHAGLGHFFVSLLFHWFIMRDLEKLAGPFRISLIYFGSGIAGNLASVLLEPHRAEVGPGGGQYGLLACLIVELLHMWKMMTKPWRALFKMLMVIMILFLLGFLPWVDNFAHIAGFITGFVLSHCLMPYIAFGQYSSYRKSMEVIFCISIFVTVFSTLSIVFYAGFGDCSFCRYLNCIPIFPEFCAEQEIDFRPGGTLVT